MVNFQSVHVHNHNKRMENLVIFLRMCLKTNKLFNFLHLTAIAYIQTSRTIYSYHN